MKRIMIFGSTGSIGRNVLSCLKNDNRNFEVLGLCAKNDINTLYAQVKDFSARYVCVTDERCARKLERALPKKIKMFKGKKGLEEFSAIGCDISFMAISGISALRPLMINLKYAKRIALANKESMVLAGLFVLKSAKRYDTEIIPVDSEINALFQLFKVGDFERMHLTASGGALFNYKKKDLGKVKVKEILSHPTWRMGKRITVDSATLVNKGFEVIEAHHFFGVPLDKIDIVIHKESTIHAFIECKDGHLFACVYPPDMKLPISFALYYPRRPSLSRKNIFRRDLSLNFSPLKLKDFPLLRLILEAAEREDNSLAVLNACDEVAIDYFLKNKINFPKLHKVMNYLFEHYPSSKIKKVEDIFFWDSWARKKTEEYLSN